MTITTPPPPPPPPPVVRPPDTMVAGAPPVNEVSRFDRWSDPLLILVGATVLAGAAFVPTVGRSLVTLPLALVLPGHALLAALRRPDRSLASSGRMALRIGLSLAVVCLVALVVGWLIEVDRFPIVAGLWLAVSGCAAVSWTHPLPRRSAPTKPLFTQSGVLLGLAAIAGVIVVVVGVLLLPEPRTEPYSRLALAGPSREADSPVVVRGRADPAVQVQVENGTDDPVSYRLIPTIDGGHTWESPKAVLDPGETWTGTISGPIPTDACVVRLRVALSANSEPSGVAPLIVYIRNERADACS